MLAKERRIVLRSIAKYIGCKYGFKIFLYSNPIPAIGIAQKTMKFIDIIEPKRNGRARLLIVSILEFNEEDDTFDSFAMKIYLKL